MKNKTRLGIIVALVFLMSVSTVSAANQFQDIIDLIADVFDMIHKIFTLPMFSTPKGAFGFLIALTSILIFGILYMGSGIITNNKKMRGLICGTLTAMIAVMMNFQPDFFFAIFGNWITVIFVGLVLAVVGVMVFFIFRLPNTAAGNLGKALLSFLSLMIVMATKANLLPLISNLVGHLKPYPIILPFAFMKKKNKKSILLFLMVLFCASFVYSQGGGASFVAPFGTILSVLELCLVCMTGWFGVKAVFGGWTKAASADGTMAAGGKLRQWGQKLKVHDKKVREYNRLSNQLSSFMARKDIDDNTKLKEIKALLEQLKDLDAHYGGA